MSIPAQTAAATHCCGGACGTPLNPRRIWRLCNAGTSSEPESTGALQRWSIRACPSRHSGSTERITAMLILYKSPPPPPSALVVERSSVFASSGSRRLSVKSTVTSVRLRFRSPAAPARPSFAASCAARLRKSQTLGATPEMRRTIRHSQVVAVNYRR